MNKKYNKSWVVFQPHTYSRTFNLLDDFAKALLNFDNIIIVDIYAARETNTFGITSEDLVNKICSLGKDAKYIPNFEDCVSYLKSNVQENDIVMTLGAGTVTEIGPMLVK
jgi:UDP-N-acetylmuramate--alanine ligase